MDLIGHDDEGVESVLSLFAAVSNGLDREQRVGFDLEDSAAIVGSRGNEEPAGSGCGCGDRHGEWQQLSSAQIDCRRDLLAFRDELTGLFRGVGFAVTALLEAAFKTLADGFTVLLRAIFTSHVSTRFQLPVGIRPPREDWLVK